MAPIWYHFCQNPRHHRSKILELKECPGTFLVRHPQKSVFWNAYPSTLYSWESSRFQTHLPLIFSLRKIPRKSFQWTTRPNTIPIALKMPCMLENKKINIVVAHSKPIAHRFIGQNSVVHIETIPQTFIKS